MSGEKEDQTLPPTTHQETCPRVRRQSCRDGISCPFVNHTKTMKWCASLALVLALCSTSLAIDLSDNDPARSLLQQYLQQSAGRQSAGQPTGRIIGGTRVVDRCVAPFNAMVALQLLPTNPNLRVTYCSGVMLSADLIVTAALCVYPYINFVDPVLTAIIGEDHFDFQDTYQVNVPVRTFKIHPQYDSVNGDNNIALIKLDSPVTLNDCVQPLPRFARNAAQCSSSLMNCTITGWGQFDVNGDLTLNSKNPLYGHIQLVDEWLSTLLAGSATYPTTTVRQNSLLGIAYPGSGVKACLLDWGGMVACNVAGDWKLRGVIGEHNCLPRDSSLPIVVTDVEKFQSWIDSCASDFNSPACLALTVSSEIQQM